MTGQTVEAHATRSATIVAVLGLRPDEVKVSFEYAPALQALEIFLSSAVRQHGLDEAEANAVKRAVQEFFSGKPLVFS